MILPLLSITYLVYVMIPSNESYETIKNYQDIKEKKEIIYQSDLMPTRLRKRFYATDLIYPKD